MISNQFTASAVNGLLILVAELTFGSSTVSLTASPTGGPQKNSGIASISRTSAGLYVLTLSAGHGANYVLGVSPLWKAAASPGFPASPTAYVVSDAITSANTITFRLGLSSASPVVDPADGEFCKLLVYLKQGVA